MLKDDHHDWMNWDLKIITDGRQKRLTWILKCSTLPLWPPWHWRPRSPPRTSLCLVNNSTLTFYQCCGSGSRNNFSRAGSGSRRAKMAPQYGEKQGCGSAFISFGSGSSILGWIPIRIRIQSGSRSLMTKNWKNYSWKNFFLSKTAIYLFLGLHIKYVQVTEEAFSSQKRPSNTSKHELLQIFFYFCGPFLPSWIRIHWPDWIRIRNPGEKWRKFMICSAGCSPLRAAGFTGSLDSVHGGLGISKLQGGWLIKKYKFFFSCPILVILLVFSNSDARYTFVSVDITVSVVAGSTIGNHWDAHILNNGPTIRFQNVTF